MSEVGRIGHAGDKTPRAAAHQRCSPPKRSESGVVKRLLPRLRGGSQNPSFRTRRKSRGRTGNQRVRVLVVSSLSGRHRKDVSTVLVWRGAARRRVGINNKYLA
jgi:hypothetical protein